MNRRIRLTVGYRGTRYSGWGVQTRSHRPTLQWTLESALASVLGHEVRTTAAGRTDAGVHAEGQVVSFDTSSRIATDGLRRVLTTRLPEDIWVVRAEQAASDFNARHSAERRWYRYAIWCTESPPAPWRGRCLVETGPLDLAEMRQAARALVGRHDFASLVTRPSRRGSTERTVFAADWLEVGPSLLIFEICGDAFLKQMVRTVVGSQLWVGTGHWTSDQFAAALAQADRRAAGPTAPAQGLTLHRIEY